MHMLDDILEELDCVSHASENARLRVYIYMCVWHADLMGSE